MLTLKGCPKCKGDLYLDRDAYGVFRQCLQCGFIQDMVARPAVPQPVAVQEKPRRKQARPKVAA